MYTRSVYSSVQRNRVFKSVQNYCNVKNIWQSTDVTIKLTGKCIEFDTTFQIFDVKYIYMLILTYRVCARFDTLWSECDVI